MSTLLVYPSGNDTSKSVSGAITNPNNAYTSYTSETYATIPLITGANAETYVYYTFDLSSIPANATINSVSCIATAFVTDSNLQRIAIKQLQLYAGNTPKGTASEIAYASNSYELNTGTWTREELDNLYLRVYAQRGTQRVTGGYAVRFKGADLTIDYTAGGSTETLKIKSNGSWQDISKVYLKQNGTWTEQANLSTLFDTEANYVKGN